MEFVLFVTRDAAQFASTTGAPAPYLIQTRSALRSRAQDLSQAELKAWPWLSSKRAESFVSNPLAGLSGLLSRRVWSLAGPHEENGTRQL